MSANARHARPAAVGAGGSRETWIDSARGLAIILVVLFHAVMYLGVAGIAGPWSLASYPLDTFRMPLFFFVSGLLAPSALALSYRDLFRKRLVLLLYLYVLWSTLQTMYGALMPPLEAAQAPVTWWSFASILVQPHPNLWFIYALPIYFTIAWLIRRWPRIVQLALAAVVSGVFGTGALSAVGVPWEKSGRYLFFFLLAVHTASIVRRLAPRVRPWHLLVLLLVYGGIVALLLRTQVRFLPFALLAAGLVATATGIALAVVLSRMRPFAFLASLGRRTLPIYLIHTFPMIAVAGALHPVAERVQPWQTALLPPALTAAAILVSLGLNRLFQHTPGVLTVPSKSWTTTSIQQLQTVDPSQILAVRSLRSSSAPPPVLPDIPTSPDTSAGRDRRPHPAALDRNGATRAEPASPDAAPPPALRVEGAVSPELREEPLLDFRSARGRRADIPSSHEPTEAP